MDKTDLVPLLFFGALLLLSVLLWVWHRSKDTEIDLTDLLVENGRVSRLAFTWLGSFMVMSFGFVYGVLTGKLSDVYAALYATTWAVPIITKMFALKPKPPETP